MSGTRAARRVLAVLQFLSCTALPLVGCGTPPEELSPSRISYSALGLACELSGSISGSATIALINQSEKPITIVANRTPFETTPSQPFEVELSGKRLRYLGERFTTIPTEETRIVEAGGRVEASFELKDKFEFDESGLARLTYRATTIEVLDEGGKPLSVPLDCGSLTERVVRTARAPAEVGVRRDGLSFQGCSSGQISTVVEAHNNALSITSAARLGTQINSSNARYKTWFGAWDNGRGAYVQAIRNDINAWLANPSSTYQCGGEGCVNNPQYAGYTYGSCPLGTVCLCPPFFSQAQQARMETVVHEVSHITSWLWDYYGEATALSLAVNSPEIAVRNADNFAFFAGYFNRSSRGDFARQNVSSAGVWRPDSGTWYIDDLVTWPVVWGENGDIAVPCDYNGDRRTDRAIFRPTNGTWFMDDGVSAPVVWGVSTDIPVPCDYNGDGRTDQAIFRPLTKTWFLNDGVTPPTVWGVSGDFLVPADYSGDGKCDIAVFRPSTGTWYINNGLTPPITMSGFVNSLPIPGDYAGNARASAATWNPVSGAFTFAVPPLGGALPATGGKANAPFNIPVVGRFAAGGPESPGIFELSSGRTLRPGQSPLPSWGTSTDTLTLLASPRTQVP